ncbi:MAG TPA: helix-turn-helix transcriptional regulator [Actinomycetota bacterium]
MNRFEVGLELARARRAAGLTQAALARRVTTTQSAISRAEAGRAAASVDLIQRIAEATGRRIELAFGSRSTRTRRDRVRRVLRDYRFDPWEREPSLAEARVLEATGLGRER